MKKIIGIAMFAFIWGIVGVNYLADSFKEGLGKEQAKYKAKLGGTFIFAGDTSMIVDYSTLNESFTLSNGKQVNAHLILR